MLALVGCERTHVETVSSGIDVAYVPGCAPARVDSITVEALGDFATRDDTVVAFDASEGPGVLADLPTEAALYRLRIDTADFRGVAIAPAGTEGERFTALVLPLGTHCSLGDVAPGSLEGRAVAALEGGDVLIAGGLVGAGPTARRDVERLRVAERRLVRDRAGLFVPRAYATGVRVGAESWLVGGAQTVSPGAPALDSFERYDARAGELVALGRLTAPRLRAGVAVSSDGAVLVAGGAESVDGPALDTLERVPADGGDAERLAGRLPWAVVEPTLAVRDDGLVLVHGRVDQDTVLALLDPVSGDTQAIDAPSRSFEAAPAIALPGARVAFVELRDGVTTGTLSLLLPDLSFVRLDGWLTSFAGLSRVHASALADGRILLVGQDDAEPTARVIDPGRRAVRVRALGVAIDALVPLDDGTIAELGEDGVRVVREDARTRFDNPGGTLLADDADAVALDAYSRWARDGLALVAQADAARLELAGLRYEDVTIELAAEPGTELLLRREDGAERSIVLDADEVGPALCKLRRTRAEVLRLQRSAASITLVTSTGERTCRLDGFEGPLAIGLRAARGTRIESLVVTRD